MFTILIRIGVSIIIGGLLAFTWMANCASSVSSDGALGCTVAIAYAPILMVAVFVVYTLLVKFFSVDKGAKSVPKLIKYVVLCGVTLIVGLMFWYVFSQFVTTRR